jgi:hypothetical protein
LELNCHNNELSDLIFLSSSTVDFSFFKNFSRALCDFANAFEIIPALKLFSFWIGIALLLEGMSFGLIHEVCSFTSSIEIVQN